MYNTRDMEKQTKRKTRETKTKKAKQELGDIKKRDGRKPTYTNPVLMAYRLGKYFHYMDNIVWENTTGSHTGKPYTDTGIDMALGIDNHTKGEIINGSLDHIILEQQDGSIILSKEGIQNKTIKDIEPEILPYALYLLGNSDYAFNKEPLHLDLATLDAIQEWAQNVMFSLILQKAKQTVQNQREYRLYDQGRTADIFSVKARDGWQDETVVTTKRELVTSSEAQTLLDEYMKTRGYMLE